MIGQACRQKIPHGKLKLARFALFCFVREDNSLILAGVANH